MAYKPLTNWDAQYIPLYHNHIISSSFSRELFHVWILWFFIMQKNCLKYSCWRAALLIAPDLLVFPEPMQALQIRRCDPC